MRVALRDSALIDRVPECFLEVGKFAKLAARIILSKQWSDVVR